MAAEEPGTKAAEVRPCQPAGSRVTESSRARNCVRAVWFRITQHMPEASDTELTQYILDECTHEAYLEHHLDDGYDGPELSAMTWHRVARAPEHGG